MKKETEIDSIPLGLPIVLTVFLGGGMLLTSLYLFVGVILTDLGNAKDPLLGILAILTPISFMAAIIGVWIFYRAASKKWIWVSFAIPNIWSAMVYLYYLLLP